MFPICYYKLSLASPKFQFFSWHCVLIVVRNHPDQLALAMVSNTICWKYYCVVFSGWKSFDCGEPQEWRDNTSRWFSGTREFCARCNVWCRYGPNRSAHQQIYNMSTEIALWMQAVTSFQLAMYVVCFTDMPVEFVTVLRIDLYQLHL